MKNIFTIDTEDWFHANYEDGLFENSASVQSTVEENTEVYLQALEKNRSTATFFVLGFVAEQHPGLVRRIADAGHEIASHGYGHQLVYKQTPEEFREDILHGKKLLEDITGKPVLGYRAPSWSITEDSLWALEILAENGFAYDSSIFPFKNFLYGIAGAPRFPYKAKKYNEAAGDMMEIPPSTYRVLGVNVPFSGGFYFRAVPYWGIKFCSGRVNKHGQPVVYYLHPREIDPQQPRLKLSRRDALIHYYGIKGCRRKLEKVLADFSCEAIRDYLSSGEYAGRERRI